MRRTVPYAGAFRPSGVNRFLPWAFIARLAAGVVAQSVYDAHRAESAKQRKQNGPAASAAAASHAHSDAPTMSTEEALGVLNVARPAGSRPPRLPLEGAERQAATANFKRYLHASGRGGAAASPYLAGKFSLAYRRLVDTEWDRVPPADATPPPPGAKGVTSGKQ